MTSPAAKNLGVGLLRPYRGRAFGGMLGAMARIAPQRPATLPNGQRQHFFSGSLQFRVF
jgi:hypothetical protein